MLLKSSDVVFVLCSTARALGIVLSVQSHCSALVPRASNYKVNFTILSCSFCLFALPGFFSHGEWKDLDDCNSPQLQYIAKQQYRSARPRTQHGACLHEGLPAMARVGLLALSLSLSLSLSLELAGLKRPHQPLRRHHPPDISYGRSDELLPGGDCLGAPASGRRRPITVSDGPSSCKRAAQDSGCPGQGEETAYIAGHRGNSRPLHLSRRRHFISSSRHIDRFWVHIVLTMG